MILTPVMTYTRYSPEQLDQLVLRVFDIAAMLREISQNAKKAKLDDIPLHDRKAVLWCEQLEQWVTKTKINLDILFSPSPSSPENLPSFSDFPSY